MTTFAKVALFLSVIAQAIGAAAPQADEIEFRFAPSFGPAIEVCLGRMPDGSLGGSVYTRPLAPPNSPSSHGAPMLLRKVSITVTDFDALVTAIESIPLKQEAEREPAAGIDGTVWTFRREVGGRVLELRFNTPEMKKGTAAYELGAKFAVIGKIQNALPRESTDPRGDIPVVVPETPFERKTLSSGEPQPAPNRDGR